MYDYYDTKIVDFLIRRPKVCTQTWHCHSKKHGRFGCSRVFRMCFQTLF